MRFWRPLTVSLREAPDVDELQGEDLSRAILSELRHSHEDFLDHAMWMARRMGEVGGAVVAVLIVSVVVLGVEMITRTGLTNAFKVNTRAIQANTDGLREQQRLARLMDTELSLQNERQRVLLEHLNAAEMRISEAQRAKGKR